MLVDYHCHLAPDDDQLGARWMTEEWIAVYADAARERGIGELALTEHCHRFVQAAGISQHPFWNETAHADLDEYVAALGTARDAGQPIRVGLELDWLGSDSVEQLRGLTAGRDLDIVLGSVHWLAGAMIDHPGYPIWESLSVERVWTLYFDELREAAGSGLYDVMAHPDLPKVFGQRPAGGVPQREYDDTAEVFAAAGVACEISSAGLRKAAAELYPAPAFLQACFARGVPITLAADGHRPEDVGRGLEHALELAQATGYRTVTAFRAREPRQEPLG
jgi:histidinol-phosphatase (PHP family)